MDNFPFIRLTFLGAEGCGKTSLISSFVNNFCPTVHQPTPGPSLYYKVARLPQEDDPTGMPTSVVIELEDTFGSNRSDEGRDIHAFFDMKRKNTILPKGIDDFTPFSIWKPPHIPMAAREPYRPLTSGRMGFIFLFDSTDFASLEEVQRLHTAFKEFHDNSKMQIRPVVYFIATKIDKDPESDEFKAVINQAERYTQKQFVRLMKVSALTAKNVKRAIYDITRIVLGNDVLWEFEFEERADSEEDDDDDQAPFCTTS